MASLSGFLPSGIVSLIYYPLNTVGLEDLDFPQALGRKGCPTVSNFTELFPILFLVIVRFYQCTPQSWGSLNDWCVYIQIIPHSVEAALDDLSNSNF